MAKKEAPESTSTAVETLEQQLARQLAAQALAAQGMRTSGSYISFKNAILKVDGQPVPNNTADVRVLAVVGERAWYDGEFDADVVQVPACYALDSTRTARAVVCPPIRHLRILREEQVGKR